MLNTKKQLSFVLTCGVLLGVAVLGVGCAQQLDDVNRLQPNATKKAELRGEFYFRSTVVDAPYATAQFMVGAQNYHMERGVFEIQEKTLYFYRTYEVVIGGDVHNVGTGAQWTGSEWFVVEADESDGTHLELPLYGTILTNVDLDHIDFYGSIEGIEAGFSQYLSQIAGPKVVCADDHRAVRLAERHGAITYGFSESADVRAVDLLFDDQ